MIVLHRDIGYVATALTLVYAISGVAVNHTHDWNPNYSIEREQRSFSPFAPTDRDAMVGRLVKVLELPGPPNNAFRPAPHQVQLFYEGWTVEADVHKGTAEVERPSNRFLLRDFNALHLNHPKGAWTWFADLYAVALAFLAISGLVMLKGKQGFLGRGKWFVLAGLAIPVVFLLVLD